MLGIQCIVGATYDVLPTPQNLSQWVGEDENSKLCMGGLEIAGASMVLPSHPIPWIACGMP